MTIYVIILVLLISIGFLDFIKLPNYQKHFILFFIFFLFVIYDGCRWETGTDWMLYREFFRSSAKSGGMFLEPGYTLLCKLVYNITDNYSYLLIVISIIFYSFYLKSIDDYAIFPLITIFLFFCSFIGYMGMNRQHLALALCLFSFRYILSKEFWKFLSIVLIAALFHRTALFFLVAFFLNKSFSGGFLVVCLIIGYLINPIIKNFLEPFLSILPSHIAYKLNFYLEDDASNSVYGVIFGSLKRAFIFLPLYLHKEKFKKEFSGFELMLNIYFLSLIIYVLFNNSIQIFVNRGNLYFGTLFEIFLIPFFLFFVKKNGSQFIVYFLIVIYAIVTFYKSLSIFYDLFVPYKSIFINSEYIRNLY